MLLLALLACQPTVDETADPVDTDEGPPGWTLADHHPRLHPHLDESGRALIADRLTREPYTLLHERIVERCEREPRDLTGATELHAPSAYYNGDIARSCAFLGWYAGDEQLSRKALDVLLQVVPDVHTLTEINDDIHVADAMVADATAYDLLMGTEGVDVEELVAARELLGERAESVVQFFGREMTLWHALARNNHATKPAAAVGMTALVINDDERSYSWMSYAMTQQHSLQQVMTSDDGMVDEGPYYHVYSALTHLPFYVAYETVSGSGAHSYDRFCELWEEDTDCDAAGPVLLEPPLHWPATVAQGKWGVDMRMPDGTRVPTDDSMVKASFGGLLDDAEARWDWANSPAQPWLSGHTTDLSVELLLRYDDEAEHTAPARGPSIFGEHFATLRTGWGPDDTFVYVSGEHGQMRATNHEDEDEGSFAIFARGAFMALDTGYSSFEERERTAHTAHHNLILVDGQGAPESTTLGRGGVDAELVVGASDDIRVPAVSVATHYAGVELERVVVLVDDGLVVVADRVEPDDGALHEYSWLLHGWAGGSEGGEASLLDDCAFWSRDDRRLMARVMHDGVEVDRAFDEAEHGFSWNNMQTHQRLRVRAEAEDWLALAVLQPRMSSEQLALVTEHDAPAGRLLAVVGDPETEERVVVISHAWTAQALPQIDLGPACPASLPAVEARLGVFVVQCTGAEPTVETLVLLTGEQ